MVGTFVVMLRAVIAWAQEHYPDHELVLAGFSFGSYIATKVATEISPAALVTIAPPVHHNDFESLPMIDFPWIVVMGDADEVVPPDEVFDWLKRLSRPPILLRFEGVGHFFHGKLIPLREELRGALGKVLV